MRLLFLVLAFWGAAHAASGVSQAPPPTPAAPVHPSESAPDAEQPLTVFRSDVAMVRLDVQVVDRGKTVTGLSREDFVVYDEGVPTSVVYYGRDTEPVHLLLVLDVSGSMRRYIEQLAKTSQQALGYLKQGDRVAIMLFARRSELFEDFTPDFARVSQRLNDVLEERSLGSGTAINAAVLSAAAQFGEAQNDGAVRRSIVMLTDNQGTNYQISDAETVEALLHAGAVFNAIVVGRAKRPGEAQLFKNSDFTPADVFTLAEQTGGEVLPARNAGETFAQMLERLRSRYSLHIRPADAENGTYRRIRVDLSPEARKRYPKAEIRSREGYTVTD